MLSFLKGASALAPRRPDRVRSGEPAGHSRALQAAPFTAAKTPSTRTGCRRRPSSGPTPRRPGWPATWMCTAAQRGTAACDINRTTHSCDQQTCTGGCQDIPDGQHGGRLADVAPTGRAASARTCSKAAVRARRAPASSFLCGVAGGSNRVARASASTTPPCRHPRVERRDDDAIPPCSGAAPVAAASRRLTAGVAASTLSRSASSRQAAYGRCRKRRAPSRGRRSGCGVAARLPPNSSWSPLCP